MNSNIHDNLQKLIDKYRDREQQKDQKHEWFGALDMIFNSILVLKGARPAYLNEYRDTADFLKIITYINTFIPEKLTVVDLGETQQPLVTRQHLVTLKTSHISDIILQQKGLRDDVQLGEFLGFQCPGLEGSGNKYKRTVVSHMIVIKRYNHEINVTTEVCTGNYNIKNIQKSAKIKADKFENALREFECNCKYAITTDDGTIIRHINLKTSNLKYVIDNMGEYENDFLNYFILNVNSWKRSITYKKLHSLSGRNYLKLMPKIAILYNMIVLNDKFGKYFAEIQLALGLDIGIPKNQKIADAPVVEFDKKYWE